MSKPNLWNHQTSFEFALLGCLKKRSAFFSELNLFHDRIEPNKHLPKTNECHPKKGSIFNRTYIIFQPLIFSKRLICFAGGIHGPIHCIASYAPIPPFKPFGSVRFLSSIPAIIDGTSGHCTIFRHLCERLDLGSLGNLWLFQGSWNMTPTSALIGGIPSNLQYIGSCLEMIPCHFPNTFFGQWGQTIYIEGKLEKSTPLKIKMTRENQVFEDVSAVKAVDFPLPCWISVGRIPFLNRFFYGKNLRSTKISRKYPKKSCLVWWVHLGRLPKKYRFRPWILLKALT